MSEPVALATVACPHCRMPVPLAARPCWGTCLHCNGPMQVSSTGVAQVRSGDRSRPFHAEQLMGTVVRFSQDSKVPPGRVFAGLQWQSDEDGLSEEWLTVTPDGERCHSLESGGLYLGNRWQHYEILGDAEVRHDGEIRHARGLRFERDGEGVQLYWLKAIRGLCPVQRQVNDLLKVEWFKARRAGGEVWLGWVRDGARSYWQWLEPAPRPDIPSRRPVVKNASGPNAARPVYTTPSRPHHWSRIGSLALVALLLMAAACAGLSLSSHRLLYRSNLIEMSAGADWLSEPFEMLGHVGHVKVEVQSGGLNNQWLETLLCLVNQQTAERRCLTLENWQYSGVEDGYGWTEDQSTQTGYFSRMPPGHYRLEVHGFSNAQQPRYSLLLTQSANRYQYLGFALWLITLPLAMRAALQVTGSGDEKQLAWIVLFCVYGFGLWGLW